MPSLDEDKPLRDLVRIVKPGIVTFCVLEGAGLFALGFAKACSMIPDIKPLCHSSLERVYSHSQTVCSSGAESEIVTIGQKVYLKCTCPNKDDGPRSKPE